MPRGSYIGQGSTGVAMAPAAQTLCDHGPRTVNVWRAGPFLVTWTWTHPHKGNCFFDHLPVLWIAEVNIVEIRCTMQCVCLTRSTIGPLATQALRNDQPDW